MGYLHIGNLYKTQDILLFRECYALEKVHGTSAHISYKAQGSNKHPDKQLHFFSGGVSSVNFEALFDKEKLFAGFTALAHEEVTIYGEAYGGSCQGMSSVYGKVLCFIVFDVQIGESWLSVPDMAQVAEGLGLEVVPFTKIPCTLEAFDAARDAPSEVAVRRGTGTNKHREGVVLRPLIELTKNNGERIIVKHRAEKFSERATPQRIIDPAKLLVLEAASAIAQEWVTPMRLTHVLDKIPGANMEQVPTVIAAMVEDVYREAKGEIVESKEAQAAIGKRTVALFREWLKSQLVEKAKQ